MEFCEKHWSALKQKIDDRALSHLISRDGEVAVKRTMQELEQGKQSATSFDPLLAAFWAITNNAFMSIQKAGGNPLYLLAEGEPDPVDVTRYGKEFEGRTWPKCPVCYVNLAHEVSCSNPKCELDKVNGYDWTLDRAADDALAKARELKLVGLPS